MKRSLKWLAVAGCVAVLAVVAGRMHSVRAAEEGAVNEHAPEAGDAASRLDRIIEKLDRVVDRMHAERMGPPDRPPQRGPGGRGGRRGREEYEEHGDQSEYGQRGPGQHGEHGGPAGPGMRGEGRPRPPRADMPPEVREMIEKRMQEARKRMEQAREKFQELEERVKKLEAEIERLKAA